jgi:ElaB/YqjD/DUF883 family membrane-anchored ribosome-binding protein
MNKNPNDSYQQNTTKTPEQLEVERAIGEGMVTAPATHEHSDDSHERPIRLWTKNLAELVRDHPTRLLGVVAGVSFLAGAWLGRRASDQS